MNINEQANFIWSIADLLRGDFKQSEYGKVILPFTVLRRFDCVLAPSKARILEANKTLTVSNKRPIFKRMTGHDYYNISQFDFEKLMDDSNAIEANLRDYIISTEQMPVFFVASKRPAMWPKFAKRRTESCADSAPERTWQSHGRQFRAVWP